MQPSGSRPVALVTGVSRQIGIGAAIADTLAEDGWEVASAGWTPYDERMEWGADTTPQHRFHADLEAPEGAVRLVQQVVEQVGPVTALVLCHAESVDSSIATTTVESFDRHMAVNARAGWLMIRAFSEQFPGPKGSGRIVGITSDHTAGNLPYGASKGALDRMVLAAAIELADLGITANVINPGATDTGWMTPEVEDAVRRRNLQPRVGQPADCANLVRFLCSPQGQWVNKQLLYSDGGVW